MARLQLIAVLIITVIHSYGAEQQLQLPEASELVINPEEDLQTQLRELQKNVSDVWTYIHELRTAVSSHLTHLRQHQVELEMTVHKLEHSHQGGHTQGDNHHHSGEQHSHSGEHHSHGGDHGSDQHSHGGDHGSDQHSHGGDHGSDHHSHSGEHSHDSHGSDGHSHSGEHHSHSGEHHSHSGEHHSHSGEHSHSSTDHSKEDTHSHSHSHSHSHGDSHVHHEQENKDSPNTEDLIQQSHQSASESGPKIEPIVTATNRQAHYHHHHDHGHTHAGPSSRSSSSSSSSNSNSLNLMNEHSFHHHHDHQSHSHHHDAVRRNTTVELPKYSDFSQYDFALCRVQPNRAIPEEQQQNVGGQVTLWQKKTGGPLNFHVRLQGFQMGDHHAHHGAHQSQQQQQDDEVTTDISEPEVGHKHGFHVHASADMSNGCQSTGPHYNPKGENHGGPAALARHVGDLGSIECDNHGITNVLFSDDVASLQGPYSIVDKSIVIHASQDDFGLGGNPESLRTGNAGTRIACCVIQTIDKIPIRYYKSMKGASQYKNF